MWRLRAPPVRRHVRLNWPILACWFCFISYYLVIFVCISVHDYIYSMLYWFSLSQCWLLQLQFYTTLLSSYSLKSGNTVYPNNPWHTLHLSLSNLQVIFSSPNVRITHFIMNLFHFYFHKLSKKIPIFDWTLISQQLKELERWFFGLKAVLLLYVGESITQVGEWEKGLNIWESPFPCGRLDKPDIVLIFTFAHLLTTYPQG